MDHVYTLLMLIVPCSVFCGHVPAPVNLTMSSQHFIHLLTWEPGPGASKDLLYDVTFCVYGSEWKTVDGCAAVNHLQCNLTYAFSDLEKTYYINVIAISETDRSTPVSYPPFIPVSDTLLELPSLRVSPCNKTLCVYLQSPSERLHSVYDKLKYTLNITNDKGAQFQKTTKGLDTVYLEVVPGVEYCVSVIITDQKVSAGKQVVCASVPAAENSMDVVISVFLCLLVLGVALLITQSVLKRFLCVARLPLVLSSFQPPYNLWLLPLPSVESLQCISVEPNAYKEVQVNEEVDQEKKDEVVAYEGRRACEDISCPEKVSEETQSSSEVPYEPTRNPSARTCPHAPTFSKEHTLAPDMGTPDGEETTPQNTTHLTHLLSVTPTQKLEKNDLTLTKHQRGDDLQEEEAEEDKEVSDDVNFFSLTLGSQNSKQQETEIDEKMNNVKLWKPEVPLIMLGPLEPVLDIQDIECSESTSCLTSYFEEEEEEEEEEDGSEEEEAFSGYMMRN